MVRGPAHLSLRLLGNLEIHSGGTPARLLPARKTRALLAFLALPAGRVHSRATLAALLWAETGDAQARNNLRHALVELRRTLAGTEVLRTEGDMVSLDAAALDVDVSAFARHVEDGTPGALAAAAELYRGDLLEGFAIREAPFDDWLSAERQRLRELARVALARLLAHQTEAGPSLLAAAIQTAGRLLTLDPLQEDVHRALMRLYTRDGRRGAALKQYQVCADVLRRDLGIDPDPQTKALYRDLLQRPSTAAVPSTPVSASPRRAAPRTAKPITAEEETLLIGRTAEQRQIFLALDQAWQGDGQVVVAVGEAGIGKSRLMRSLVAEVRARGGRSVEGRAYETEQVLALGPWVEALRDAQLVEDAALLDRIDPVWRSELARLLPELSGAERGPAQSSADPRRLFEAVARGLTGLADDAPLLVFLDDVHWADETSLRLLAFVARRIRTARVMIAITLRDEEVTDAGVVERVLAELAREPHVTRLNLGRLSEPETAALVQALVRTADGPQAARRLEQRVWTLSEGNPFMAVETIRAWQEATPAAGTPSVTRPERVRHVIVGRLGRLGDRARQIAAVAAVIGREFDFVLAAQAAGLDKAVAAEGVEELVRRRILQGVGERLAFTHDQIRDVAYLELLPVRRRLLHAQVATAIEALHTDDLRPHYTALARHHRESESWERAVFYFRHAAEQAAARGAHREAAANLEQALDALTHLPESRGRREQAIDMRLRLGDHLFILADVEHIGVHATLARQEVEALEDPRRLERVLAMAGSQLRLTGRYREAIEISERACALASPTASPGVAADHAIRQAPAWYSLGEHRRVIELARQALELLPGHLAYEHFGFGHSPAAFALYFLAISMAELGEFAEAQEHAEESLRVAEAVGMPLSILAGYCAVGFTKLRIGALPDAVNVLERALQRYDPGEISFWTPILASMLGSAYVLLGRVSEGEAQIARSIEQFRSAGVVANQCMRLVWLGEADLESGRPEAAARHAAQALEMARAHHERGHHAYVLKLQGDVAAAHGVKGFTEALARYDEARDFAHAMGLRPLEAHCELALSRLHSRAGNQEKAHTAAGSAAAMYREMGMTFWLGQAEAVLRGRSTVRGHRASTTPGKVVRRAEP